MELFRGDDTPIDAVFRGKPDGANPRGGPFDLTGCTLWFTVKRADDASADDDAALVALWWSDGGAASGIAVTDLVNGVAELTIPSSAALVAGEAYRYDVQVKNGAGGIRTLDVGEVVVKADITKRETVP